MDIYIENRSEEEVNEDIIKKMEDTVKAAVDTEGFGMDFEVSISIVSDDEIKSLNSEYRNMDKVTDVLSFPMYDEGDPEPVLLGDIIISYNRARSQSEDYGHSVLREICYLTAHGMLHLLGYDHMNESDKKDMRQKEEEIMKKMDLFR
ncbi:MAG: rRNA maturation RNase YbeY [Eubacteriaceae bacterium]|nr:rRNA maturation RNase YbeY [Eubacteriaceae bacterium]